ncbi:hypothetical protein CBW46_006665 [Paenibacillus xerothermodurans]|uniref:Uncharacterized protein n=1 Tax=Paenibacillus xerothermodurans TaxID=1977292 RepID=A0A2W1NC11_PAEXE|nr:hypothetical protein CBW46_006665 [Paenibacillus xerothermodurans]
MYIILGLALIGVAAQAAKLIVPIVVFGVIFLLYKFPPNTWGKRNRRTSGSARPRRSKNASFRVIDGNKDGSDEPPKYH